MKKHFMIGLLAVHSCPRYDSGSGRRLQHQDRRRPTGGTFNTFTNAMAVYVPK